MRNLLLTMFLLLSLSIEAETLHGVVVKIADGDTLTILTSSTEQVKVRLEGIDTPERKQPYGYKAKQALEELVLQKDALVEVETKDRYGRTVGIVFVEGMNINNELVRQGMAWVYRKYSNDQTLLSLEAEARHKQLGLWSSDNPIEPWLWRKGKRTVEHETASSIGMVIGNRNSHIYHLSNCPSYSMVSKKNRVLFTDEKLAVANNYRKAKNCP